MSSATKNSYTAETFRNRMREQQEILKYRMKEVKHTVTVISGKGG